MISRHVDRISMIRKLLKDERQCASCFWIGSKAEQKKRRVSLLKIKLKATVRECPKCGCTMFYDNR